MGAGGSCENVVSGRETQTLCPMMLEAHFFTLLSAEHQMFGKVMLHRPRRAFPSHLAMPPPFPLPSNALLDHCFRPRLHQPGLPGSGSGLLGDAPLGQGRGWNAHICVLAGEWATRLSGGAWKPSPPLRNHAANQVLIQNYLATFAVQKCTHTQSHCFCS